MDKKELTLLNGIKFPEDLRHLNVDQLPQLCDELRRDIIEEVAVNPGHLASSLGVVEITVALHYVYNTPEDRIVWDVGHQAYGHKILTGRREQFCTNRKLGGIKPFPSPFESEYDTFACGHASNSISAALGMAVAAELEGNKNRHVVAVIGDGAMSGGLAYEGLNNVSSSPNDLLIILNDNNMSIDRSVGGMKQYLLNLSTNETYNALRFKAARWLNGKGMLNDDRKKGIIRFTNALKSAISHQQNVFEGMNIRYFGPFDGHNVKELVRILKQIKEMKGPKLLHLHTQKGHGYAPAEKDVTIWHAPGKFNPDTGERIVDNDPNKPQKYQDVFGHTLLELAKQNPKIVGVTPAMPSGCSMNIMMKEMPERTFDVGIAEGHAVTFSGGMAKDGLLPFCNIYRALAQRAFDNIIHDVALLNLNVVFCFDRAGLVGEDGPTHHGLYSFSFLRQMPNLTILAPSCCSEMHSMLQYAWSLASPVAICYPRAVCPSESVASAPPPLESRKAWIMQDPPNSNLTIWASGGEVARAFELVKLLQDAKPSIQPRIVNPRFLLPFDEATAIALADTPQVILDDYSSDGLTHSVRNALSMAGKQAEILSFCWPDNAIVPHGSLSELREAYGLTLPQIAKKILAKLS